MVQLRPMTEDEFRAYLDRSLQEYADEMVRSGTWAQEDAPRRARETFDNLLPHGLHTADHYLYTLVAEEEAQPVGMLWFALIRRGSRPEAFIYDIHVDEAFRRRGYATQALQALERNGRARWAGSGSACTSSHITRPPGRSTRSSAIASPACGWRKKPRRWEILSGQLDSPRRWSMLSAEQKFL